MTEVASATPSGPVRDTRVGVVLEVEEFAVHDGPGIRTVVFLKGCPLACSWCHNPEAIEFGPQVLPGEARCPACGQRAVAMTTCPACGRDLPAVAARLVGESMSVDELAARLLQHRRVLSGSGGGVTFSGGEPMAQADFVVAVARAVRPLHVAVETSGQVAGAVFRRVVDTMDLVMIDIKHTDPQVHRRFTGHDNRMVLANVARLCAGATPFVVRVPLIPGVNDDEANLERTARLVAGAPALRGVELLPYNTMAPAKYARAGRQFRPGFDTTRAPRVDRAVFERYDIPCEVL
jgi:pyruvate formate lyase activating enzyme